MLKEGEISQAEGQNKKGQRVLFVSKKRKSQGNPKGRKFNTCNRLGGNIITDHKLGRSKGKAKLNSPEASPYKKELCKSNG